MEWEKNGTSFRQIIIRLTHSKLNAEKKQEILNRKVRINRN